PNLDMLGVREPAVYGSNALVDLEKLVVDYGASKGVSVECYQSNHEGCLIDKIHEAHTAYDGIVYNPGAHTHYSYALRDAVGGIDTPCVEVHISNVDAREAFRHISVIAPACVAQVKGRGFKGYCDAIDILLEGPRERLGEGFEERYPAGEVIAAPLK
ncbi:type II 3-dehydroquinate dehydratase, partial [Ellagibacter isourolithinifaciens]|uniref:type II 3-dehydroquinate dehydratase n=1 Tax=Ellagibacter isourolithinifaciens TaxID=2137581 RepID=UPI003AB440E1